MKRSLSLAVDVDHLEAGTTLSPVYDANGNMTGDGTRTLTWDSRNRLTAISGTTASYSYDGSGRRTVSDVAGPLRA